VIQAKANGAGEQWNLDALQIRLGDNSISGKGSLQQKLAGQIDIKLARLAQLWPQLRGQVTGRCRRYAEGTQGKLGPARHAAGVRRQSLQSLNLDATLDSAQRAKIDLKGSGIQAGDTNLGTLTASAQGDIKTRNSPSICKGRS
jgi:translocation and assembly module TamB